MALLTLDALPARIARMEGASQDVLESLRRVSVAQLQALRPTPEYQPLIESLIELRRLLGE